ncbi:MAG TPA: AsmA family protein [Roseiarcus sp.]|nr:AsmA family protein [Roseiarcus sp.]
MRHWGIATGVALGAAFGLSLGLVNWPINRDHVRRDLTAVIGPVETPAVATLRLLPRPTLRLQDLRFRTTGGAIKAQAADAQVTLSLTRLLFGAIQPLGLTLSGAEFTIDLDTAERELKTMKRPPIARLFVESAVVAVVSARRALNTHFDIATARIDWDSASSALRAGGAGRWRGQPLATTLVLDEPMAAARGDPTPVRVALDGPLGQWRVAGDWSPQGRLDGAVYRGQVSALIPSLARFARWIGQPPPGPAPAGLELAAHVSASATEAKFSDVVMTLGGQRFEGDLAAMKSPARVSVSGTMAADTLDLDALIGPPPTAIDAGGWSKTPALPAPSRGLDLDLRISASRAVWRGHAIEDAAAAVSQRNGRFDVKLLEADYARGSLSGELSIQDDHGACASALSLSLEKADLGALLGEFGEHNFSGEGSLKLSVKAHGRSPADIIASAAGDGALEIADGALRNLNFEEALRRGQHRLIDVARDMNAGATRFGAAHGRVEIGNGEARFVDVATQSPGVSLAVTGDVDLVGRAWRAHVTARQSSSDGTPTPDGAHMDFALYGPWKGPVIAPVLPPAD